MRPDQQEMPPMALWVATAPKALEDRKAPSGRLRLGQLEEGRRRCWRRRRRCRAEVVAMVSTDHMDHLMEQMEAMVDMM